jgi:hypothetical protein
MCTNYRDRCPISSRGACESVPIASPDLSLCWLVARPVVTHHHCKHGLIAKAATIPHSHCHLLTNYLHRHWHFAVYSMKVKQLSKGMLEQTYHSPTKTPNHLHIHQNLDLVWLRIGQISNHLTVVVGIFNINGIVLAGQKR